MENIYKGIKWKLGDNFNEGTLTGISIAKNGIVSLELDHGTEIIRVEFNDETKAWRVVI